MTRRPAPVRWEELPLDKVTEMVARKTVAGDELVLVQSYLKKGALVPRHVRAAEQMVYVLQGALRVILEAEEVTVRQGDVLAIPSLRPRQAEALDDTFVLAVTRHLR
jgi:quercetin dioxygenase-like cupin family protein